MITIINAWLATFWCTFHANLSWNVCNGNLNRYSKLYIVIQRLISDQLVFILQKLGLSTTINFNYDILNLIPNRKNFTLSFHDLREYLWHFFFKLLHTRRFFFVIQLHKINFYIFNSCMLLITKISITLQLA